MLSSTPQIGQTARNLNVAVHGETEATLDTDALQQFAPTEPVPTKGLWGSWGFQAWVDLTLGKLALSRLSPLVPHTLVPIIKLCSGNREEVEAAYRTILGYREPIRFLESPGEKWRRLYGNFVREIEWACSELRKYFNKRAYEDLVINATADCLKGALGPIIDSMKTSMVSQSEALRSKSPRISDLLNNFSGKMTVIMFEKVFNMTGWLAGDVKVRDVNLREGMMLMEYTDCQMLRAPRMKNLPEESCLLACKGACEKIFEDGPVRMTLDTRLPETTCEVRMFLAGE
jgi:hypothetical protein